MSGQQVNAERIPREQNFQMELCIKAVGFFSDLILWEARVSGVSGWWSGVEQMLNSGSTSEWGKDLAPDWLSAVRGALCYDSAG